jgi:nicotinamidase-related amidase
MAASELPRGPLSSRTAHLCVDMQELFAQETPWHTPWMERVLPQVARIADAHQEATIYTRFIPPKSPEEVGGSWRVYYQHWREMTLERLNPQLLELVDPLRGLSAAGKVIDKRFFSPFHATALASILHSQGVDSLVITGAETDMCVLAAVLDAVDLGLRVVLPENAICSSADEMHEALLTLYRSRFSQQVETSDSDTILRNWPS